MQILDYLSIRPVLIAIEPSGKQHGLLFATTGLVNSTEFLETVLHSIHFRQVFYLVSISAITLLLLIKYLALPAINRRESAPKRVLRYIIDTLIAILIIAIAVCSLLFWIGGNDQWF